MGAILQTEDCGGKPEIQNPTENSGQQQVVGDGMVGRFDDVNRGDLGDDFDGVHVPDSKLGTDRYEEPIAQESEDPYER